MQSAVDRSGAVQAASASICARSQQCPLGRGRCVVEPKLVADAVKTAE